MSFLWLEVPDWSAFSTLHMLLVCFVYNVLVLGGENRKMCFFHLFLELGVVGKFVITNLLSLLLRFSCVPVRYVVFSNMSYVLA